MNDAKPFPYRLYLVTDQRACLGRDLIKVAELAVKGGVDLVQLREKDLTQREFLEKALRLKDMLDRHDVPLIINDNFIVAKACDANGIHVGNSDVSPASIRALWADDRIVGYSVEELSHVHNDAAQRSDYLGISPVFSTPTKTDTKTVWGLEGIRQIRRVTSLPLVAIGGLNDQNIFDVVQAGADCVAVVSAICSSPDPERTAAHLRSQIEKALMPS